MNLLRYIQTNLKNDCWHRVSEKENEENWLQDSTSRLCLKTQHKGKKAFKIKSNLRLILGSNRSIFALSKRQEAWSFFVKSKRYISCFNCLDTRFVVKTKNEPRGWGPRPAIGTLTMGSQGQFASSTSNSDGDTSASHWNVINACG